MQFMQTRRLSTRSGPGLDGKAQKQNATPELPRKKSSSPNNMPLYRHTPEQQRGLSGACAMPSRCATLVTGVVAFAAAYPR